PVIANFPAGFTQEAARRLVSIVSSGARCGVYSLMTVDTRLEPPQGFTLESIEQHTVALEWKENRFVWKDPDFEKFPLKMEGPPPASLCTPMLQTVGEKAKEAKRVEVPFEFIAAAPEQWWTSDSRGGV